MATFEEFLARLEGDSASQTQAAPFQTYLSNQRGGGLEIPRSVQRSATIRQIRSPGATPFTASELERIIDPRLTEGLQMARGQYRSAQQQALALGQEDVSGAPPEGLLNSLFRTLDLPRAAVFNAARAVFDPNIGFEEFLENLEEREGFGEIGPLVMREDDSGIERVLKGGAAFLGDVFTDPLALISFGGTVVGKKLGSEVVQAAVSGRVLKYLPENVVQEFSERSFSAQARSVLGDVGLSDEARAALKAIGRQSADVVNPIEIGRQALGDAAAEALQGGGAIGLRRFFTAEKGTEIFRRTSGEAVSAPGFGDAGKRLWESLPADIKGGLRIRIPFARQENVRRAILLSGGGGRFAEAAGLAPVVSQANRWRGLVRASKASQALSAAIGGTNGDIYGKMVADTIHGNSEKLEGWTYGLYRTVVQGKRQAHVSRKAVSTYGDETLARMEMSLNNAGTPDDIEEAKFAFEQWVHNPEELFRLADASDGIEVDELGRLWLNVGGERRKVLDRALGPNDLPPVPAGHTRIFRGEGSAPRFEHPNRGAWWTQRYQTAREYALGDENVFYADVPNQVLDDLLEPQSLTRKAIYFPLDPAVVLPLRRRMAVIREELGPAGESRVLSANEVLAMENARLYHDSFRHLFQQAVDAGVDITELNDFYLPRTLTQAKKEEIAAGRVGGVRLGSVKGQDPRKRREQFMELTPYLDEEGAIRHRATYRSPQAANEVAANRARLAALRNEGKPVDIDVIDVFEEDPGVMFARYINALSHIVSEARFAQYIRRSGGAITGDLAIAPVLVARPLAEAIKRLDEAAAQLQTIPVESQTEAIRSVVENTHAVRAMIRTLTNEGTLPVEEQMQTLSQIFKTMDNMSEIPLPKTADPGQRSLFPAGDSEKMIRAARKEYKAARNILKQARTDVPEPGELGEAMAKLGLTRLGARQDDKIKNIRPLPPELDLMYAPEQMRLGINKFYEMHGPQAQGFVNRWYRPYLTMFKMSATIGRGPGFHIRNVVGGEWNNDLQGATLYNRSSAVKIVKARVLAGRRARKEVAAESTEKTGLKGREVTGQPGFWQAVDQRTEEILQQRLGRRQYNKQYTLYDVHRLMRELEVDWRPGRLEALWDVDVLGGLPVGANRQGAPTFLGEQAARAARAVGREIDPAKVRLTQPGRFSARLYPGLAREEMSAGQKMAEGMANLWWIRFNAGAAEMTEAYLRGTSFLRGLDLYGDPEIARLFPLATQFDYQDLSDFERAWMRGSLIPFYCVPTDTEALTRRGWRKQNELVPGEDELLVLDPETHEQRWEVLQDVATFDYDYDLLRYKGGSAEFLFTPDHRWAYVSGDGQQRGVKRAYQMHKTDKVPWVGSGIQDKDSILSPRLAAILGWVVTDGYFRWRGNHCEMLVYQSPKKHLNQVISLLGTRPRRPHPDTGVVPVPVSLEDTKALVEAGFKDKADLPAIVGLLSRPAAEAMWQAMVDAEASVHHRAGTQFVQQPGPVLESFQMLSYLTGRGFFISPERDSGVAGGYVRSSRFTRLMQKVDQVHYKGVVWCPKTPTGTWFMRRNGAVIPTGNTWTRHNVPLQVRGLFQQPGKMNRLNLALDNAEEAFGDDADVLPEWMRERFMFVSRFKFDGNPLAFGAETPAQDLNEWFKVGQPDTAAFSMVRHLMSATNPAFQVPMQLATGTEFFTGARLDETTGRHAPWWYQRLPQAIAPTWINKDGDIQGDARIIVSAPALAPWLGQSDKVLAILGLHPGVEGQNRRVSDTIRQLFPVVTAGTLTPQGEAGELFQRAKRLRTQAMRYADPEDAETVRLLRELGFPLEQISGIMERVRAERAASG